MAQGTEQTQLGARVPSRPPLLFRGLVAAASFVLMSKLSDRQPLSVERHFELQIICHRKIAMLICGSLQRLVRPILPGIGMIKMM